MLSNLLTHSCISSVPYCAECFSQHLHLLQLVEDMCLHKMAGQLYGKLQQECDAHISAQLARLAADQTMDPVLALEKVSNSPPQHSADPRVPAITLATLLMRRMLV